MSNPSKFAILIQELEKAGAEGHQAYELANQVDSCYINFANSDAIAEIAKEIVEQEKMLGQCEML